MADKKNRLAEINTRNRAGLGWTAEDFGTFTGERQFPIPGQLEYTGVGELRQPTALPKDGLTRQLPANTPIQQVLSPQEIQRVRSFVKNPQEVGIVSGAVTAGATFLSNLFNTEDEKENLVETAWDGMLNALMWPNDQVNHLTAALISVAPGGMRTLSWDEANKVSAGQALITDQGTRAGRIRRGEGNAFVEALGLGTLTGLAAFNNPESPVQQPNFDVTTAQGKAAFDSGYEKFFSGVTDFGMAFADPLLIAGVVSKIARVKMVDRIIVSDAQRTQLAADIATGHTAAPGKAAPIAETLKRWTEVNPETGRKVVEYEEIYNHKAVKNAANRDQLAAALYNARDVIVQDALDPNVSKAINGYDLAGLIMRWAYNDMDAAVELAAQRADIADALALADRNRLGLMYALNPAVRDKSIGIAQSLVTKADNQIRSLERQGLFDSPDWDAAVRARGIAQSTMDDLVNGKFDVLQQSTPDAEAMASRVFSALVDNNTALRQAIGADRSTMHGIGGSLLESTAGFARNNRLGRRVESRRREVAKSQYEQAASRGQMRGTGKMEAKKRGDQSAAEKMQRVANPFGRSFWTVDTFGNGFTRDVNVWRRASAEAPSAFIITKGLGAQESVRELRAVFNSIRLYSGEARRVVLDDGTVLQVGGVQRKQDLIQQYADALQATTAGGADAAQALRRIERAIESDMYSWYGVHRDNAAALSRQAFASREKLMKGLTDEKRGFWIDENGQFNLIKDPWLESQIQNGTFMQNYRELERLLDRLNKSGMDRLLSDGTATVGRGASTVLGWFNEIWRPLVLMRLGYTMRNNIEGQFRAAAFTGSLDPFSAAMVNAGYTAKSLYARMAGYRNIDRAAAQARIDAAKAGGKQLPRKYEPWLRDQVNGVMRRNSENQAYISTQIVDLAEYSPEIKSWAQGWLSKTISRLSSDSQAARSRGATAEADEIDDVIDTMLKQGQQINAITTFQKFNRDAITSFDNLKLVDMELDNGYQKLAQLDDDAIALSMFFRQSPARSRAYSGVIEAPDSRTLAAAFNPDNPFSPVALSLLSGDGTYRSMLSGKASGLDSLFRAKRQMLYERVSPNDPTYWDGVAAMLRQVRFSGIGQRLMRGQTDDQIVEYLLRDRDGVEVLRFLNGGVGETRKIAGQDVRVNATRQVEVNGQQVRIGAGADASRENALFFVQQARHRYEQLTPTPELRRFVETQPFGLGLKGKGGADSTIGFTGDELKDVFERSGGDPKQLVDVVGSKVEEFGWKNGMDAWRSATAFTMRWLGTIPEDTFVRSPFYGARYQSTVETLVKSTMSQTGPITARDIDRIQRAAHARALKDTKDWLYTIDRPTLLGSIGETSIPFISAAQNSMTTLGRLIYNDPNTAVVLAALWSAPAKAGMEDDQGNIVIPIPHEWLPDSVEKAFGLDAMRNWKINKKSLNVIVPESGFGFVPRPGPTVAVPVSELMKRGWLGQQVESPGLLRTIFGKERADDFWNVYKNYMFGEGQGVAPDTLSTSLFLPPVAQRIMQLIQKDNNQQFGYWYNAIMRSEWAKYSAGMRDKPTTQEIMNQTVGFTLLRLVANLTAITPPQYESIIDPMVQTVRYYERTMPNDSNRIINEKYGPILQLLGDFSNSANNAGMLPTADSVERARKYSGIIRETAAGLDERGDMSVLTMLTMGNANQLYDDSAYGWQYANVIPGTNRSFREWQSPAQSWVQSDVNAGWATYLRGEDAFEARARQMGALSYRDVPQLKAERDAWLADLRDNPFFENWYRDYKDFGSSRTRSAIYLMEKLITNEQFMNDNWDNTIWQIAPLYLQHRNMVLQAVAESGLPTINSPGNENIRAYWDQVRADLKARDPMQWGAFVNRFLNGDENPETPGVTFM